MTLTWISYTWRDAQSHRSNNQSISNTYTTTCLFPKQYTVDKNYTCREWFNARIHRSNNQIISNTYTTSCLFPKQYRVDKDPARITAQRYSMSCGLATRQWPSPCINERSWPDE
jgi:hypothetical protein